MTYDQLIQIYGIDLNISKIYFNSSRVGFKGTKRKDGNYIICDIILVTGKYGELTKNSVIVPLDMLHALADVDVLSKTIFKSMLRSGDIDDKEISDLIRYYNNYDKIIDNIFNKNNTYGITSRDFNRMISQSKLTNQLANEDSVLPKY
jgi:hypothetical protein